MQKRLLSFITLFSCLAVFSGSVLAQNGVDARLQAQVEATYGQWRNAMLKKNFQAWSQYTAAHRKIAIKNRILSEKKAYPGSLFSVPTAPPALKGLKPLRIVSNGATANAVYFGKIDFGVGGNPPENLLLLSFVNERGIWKYSSADFIRLNELKDVRAKLKAGDLSYVNHKDFAPTGKVPRNPIEVRGAQYIAKVYVFCPGREVRMKVNKISDHRFQNTKMAEVVIGGAKDGLNEVQFATKALEGSKGTEALSIRVYLMSTVKGVKPIKVFEYQLNENDPVKPFGSANFMVDEKIKAQLMGK